MSGRFGEKARAGEPVGNAGQRRALSTTQQPYEQTFTSPGTWTWPGNVTHVEVLLVGGGGGGGSNRGVAPPVPSTFGGFGSGGGGGVRLCLDVPVSAPVPITVGAGGAGGIYPSSSGAAGNDSAFGPISPPIPPSTFKVGGGGGGYSGPSSGAGLNAPPDGGGGGGAGAGFTGGLGGAYGCPGVSVLGGGALSQGSAGLTNGLGLYGYGYGGSVATPWQICQVNGGAGGRTPDLANRDALANTGGGGGGGDVTSPAANYNGGNGGSGIVIVRWWQ